MRRLWYAGISYPHHLTHCRRGCTPSPVAGRPTLYTSDSRLSEAPLGQKTPPKRGTNQLRQCFTHEIEYGWQHRTGSEVSVLRVAVEFTEEVSCV